MKIQAVNPVCVRSQETISRLIGKVEVKKLRFRSNYTDYRLNAVLEATLCRLKADMVKIQTLQVRKSLPFKPNFCRQKSVSALSNSDIQNGDQRKRPSVTVTSDPVMRSDCNITSSVEQRDSLGIEDFFQKLRACDPNVSSNDMGISAR